MDLDADIKVMHCLLMALIDTHHDRDALRARFVSIATQLQAVQAASTSHEQTRKDFPIALQRYLNHFDGKYRF